MVDNSVKRKIDPRCSREPIASAIKALRRRLQMDQVVFSEHIGVSQGTVSEWEKGDHPPPAIALMAIGRLDFNNEMWWYEQAGFKYADRLRTVRQFEDARAKRGDVEEIRAGLTWEPDLMAFVIETVDAKLKAKNRKATSRKFAELVVLIYEYCHKTGERDADIVERILKIA